MFDEKSAIILWDYHHINQELKKYKLNYEIGECDSFSYYIKNEISNNLSIKEYILKK